MARTITWALRGIVFVAFTWLWHIADRITGDVFYGWVENWCASELGWTAPSMQTVVSYFVQFAPPMVLTIACFYAYHVWYSGRSPKQEQVLITRAASEPIVSIVNPEPADAKTTLLLRDRQLAIASEKFDANRKDLEALLSRTLSATAGGEQGIPDRIRTVTSPKLATAENIYSSMLSPPIKLDTYDMASFNPYTKVEGDERCLTDEGKVEFRKQYNRNRAILQNLSRMRGKLNNEMESIAFRIQGFKDHGP